jgi:hypothetical protein
MFCMHLNKFRKSNIYDNVHKHSSSSTSLMFIALVFVSSSCYLDL